jgi:hypothetical protein
MIPGHRNRMPSAFSPYLTDVLPGDPCFKFVQKMRDLGIWTGGYPLVGYDIVPGGGHLVINEEVSSMKRNHTPHALVYFLRCFVHFLCFTDCGQIHLDHRVPALRTDSLHAEQQ